MIISFLALLPTFFLFSFDVAAEGVSKDLCSEMDDEAKGHYAAISFGILSCDNPILAGARGGTEGETRPPAPPSGNSRKAWQVQRSLESLHLIPF